MEGTGLNRMRCDSMRQDARMQTTGSRGFSKVCYDFQPGQRGL